VVYVKDALVPAGAFHVVGGGDPDLLIVVFGSIPVVFGGPPVTPFKGAVIAPNTALMLGAASGPHTGFFAAKDVVVGHDAKVQYAPPLAIASAANPSDLDACVRMLTPPAMPAGTALEVAWQAEIARYCTAPDTPSCTSSLIAHANVDYTAAAQRTVAHGFSPAQYIALSRDRSRKLLAAEKDPGVASALCAGPDSDGDWVPDAKDKCPGTPDMTATDDQGCAVPLPHGPSAFDVQRVLASMGMIFNPRCAGAPPPPEVSAAALYQTATPANGTFISTFRVTNQPTGCSVWYQFEIRELLHGVPVKAPYSVAFLESEAMGPVGGLSGLPAVPPNLVQFNAKPTDPGTRGVLGRNPLTPERVNFRVRAVSANGRFGPWSEWKLTSQQDCRALGITCSIRN